MLSDVIQKIAEKAGGIFAAAGTDYFDVIRSAEESDGYGNVGETGDEEEAVYTLIPGSIEAEEGDARFIAGGEWTTYKVEIPVIYQHPESRETIEIVLKVTDKLRKREREGVNPEQLLTINTIRPQHGVFYRVICSFNETSG